ncbi:MAG TPA: hypothetical protein VIH29_05685 [Gallionella sp.]
MDAQVVWLWNGWGALFLAGVALWQFLHIAVSVFFQGLYFLRDPLALFLGLPSIILGFVLGGWVVGLLNIVLGVAIATTIARMIVIFRERN